LVTSGYSIKTRSDPAGQLQNPELKPGQIEEKTGEVKNLV
jgi:hypothetical protein